MPRFAVTVLTSVLFVSLTMSPAPAADDEPANAARAKAIEFLKTSQSAEGTWGARNSVGITGLVTYALIRSDVPLSDPALVKALDKLAHYAQPDGRLCLPDSRISGYETAIVYMALHAANADGKYNDLLANGEKFLRSLQLDESEDISPTDRRYGGIPYGPGPGQPDLSNTDFFLEALQASGASSHDPDIKKALAFVSRCQNLKSEFNDSPSAAEVNDGGFQYGAGGDAPRPGRQPEPPASYGSMTYAGLKSMLIAGLTPEDPRVQAALGWIRKSYSVTENPGQGANGLFYYYQLFAKCLSQLGADQFEDAQGTRHNWRQELAAQLCAIQKPNGSWVNTATRWLEGDPNLATAYALIALSYCQAK